MIIDVHTHTPTHRDAVPPTELSVNPLSRPDHPVQVTNTWNDYFDALRMVDRAVVFNIFYYAPSRAGAGAEPDGNVNDATAAFVRQSPGRVIGFLSVHPHLPDALDEIDRCVNDLGLRGVKLAPNYQQFDPLGAPARSVYARAQELGLPILFHQGTSPIREAPLRYTHPLLVDEIATEFPRLRIVMAHMGHPWQVDTIVVIRKHPHVYADVSALFYRPWSFYNCMRAATEWGVLKKLMFGSDYPYAAPQETLDGLRRVNDLLHGTVLPPVPLDEIEAIIHRDSLSLLGLD